MSGVELLSVLIMTEKEKEEVCTGAQAMLAATGDPEAIKPGTFCGL